MKHTYSSKLIFSVVLVFCLCLSSFLFATPVSAASISNNSLDVNDLAFATLGQSNIPIDSYSFDSTPDNNVLEFYIIASNNGVSQLLTRTDIKNFKIGISILSAESSFVLDSTKIVYEKNTNYAKIKLTFVENLVSTKSHDYSINIYPTINKTYTNSPILNIYGTYGNNEQDVYNNYVYAGDTPVINAKNYINNIHVDSGNGVTITTNMFEEKKYYVSSSIAVPTEKENLLLEYPDIEASIILRFIGLNGSISFDPIKYGYDKYIYLLVPNQRLMYIGRTGDSPSLAELQILYNGNTEQIELDDEMAFQDYPYANYQSPSAYTSSTSASSEFFQEYVFLISSLDLTTGNNYTLPSEVPIGVRPEFE